MTTQLSQNNITSSSCLIIGGGIAGLIAGNTLHNHGLKVTILDKGRGIGGRLATRRVSHPDYGEGIFDYGAPHFTVSSPTFQTLVDEWLKQGIVKAWSNGKTYYCGVESNRAIAKYLAQNLDVHTSTKVTQIQWKDTTWEAHTEQGTTFEGDTLLLTPPIPQTLALFDNSHLVLPPQLRERLAEVVYHPCIAVLALLAQPSQIPSPGGLYLDGDPLVWMGCNYQKGISPQAYAVTLHASPEYSQTHWETDDEVIFNDLLTSASPWLDSEVVTYQIHRWRYSQPDIVYGEPLLALTQPGPLVLAGDGFIAAKLEGAVLSGLAAANYLLG